MVVRRWPWVWGLVRQLQLLEVSYPAQLQSVQLQSVEVSYPVKFWELSFFRSLTRL